ncbi:MAG: hypothetical protein HYV09_29400 [Deltaproteobacteria bacterium]|nr:hypothetical protein [Deltaproteobacteria bacterium]
MSDSGGAKRCGPQIELTANEAARVTRCTCGTLHVTLRGNGITLQLAPDAFRHVSNALAAAVRLVDLTDKAGEAPVDQVN